MQSYFPSVTRLIPRLKSGDETAWNELCDQFRPGLQFKYELMVKSTKGQKSNGEDVVQETFIKAWNSRDGFQGTTTPQICKWLLVILRNTFLDFYRKEKPSVENATWFEFYHTDSTPSANAISIEEEARLHAAISELDRKYQQVLMLRHFEGLKFVEMANRLQSKPNSIATLYRRGLCKLADKLKSEGLRQ